MLILKRTLHNYVSSKILVTGGLGQLGIMLTKLLRNIYGSENVIATDIRKPFSEYYKFGSFMHLDVLDINQLNSTVVSQNINTVVHLSSILSAAGEKNVNLSLDVNLSIRNILEIAKIHQLKVLFPSTIGVFGPSSPKDEVNEVVIQDPNTTYGITKLFGELLGTYYYQKFGVDFRCVRLPGILSAGLPLGGGTTDYAIEMFHAALKKETYKCFLKQDTRLPMMYLSDCLAGLVQILQADSKKLNRRVYNLDAISFTPKELENEIKLKIKGFEVEYCPDFRQSIAETWPRSLNGENARKDFGWSPRFDIKKIVDDMILRVKIQDYDY